MKNVFMIALIMAGATLFVVFWDSPPEVFLRESRTQVEELPKADSYMTQTETRKFDENGREAYRINGTEGRYFTRADRFELDNPVMVTFPEALGPEKPGPEQPDPGKNSPEQSESGRAGEPWHLQAKKAFTSEQGTRVVMNGKVYAWQENANGLSELRTAQLEFFPETRQARSGKKVTIDTPQGRTTGVGMTADFENEEYQLLSQVKSVQYGQ